MKTCIYRGTNEIGGNCIEFATDQARVLMDVGLPLISMEEDRPITDYRVPCRGLYADQDPEIDAIFISHGHPDHYGLLPLVNPKIPVYMSKTLHDILIKIQPILPGDFDISHLDIRDIAPNESVQIGDLTITARPVDHAPAALAFELTDGGRRALYTGDIRFHSNQAYKSWKLADAAHAPDYLFMEGTRLSRAEATEKYPTEESVRDALTDLLRNSNRAAFMTFSSQNLDRLCSVISACRRSGRTLVIDPYTAALLDVFHESFASVPQTDILSCVRVYFGTSTRIADKMKAAGLFYVHAAKKITKEEIQKNPSQFLIKHNFKLLAWLQKNGMDDYDFIYSMWHGYLSRQNTWDAYMDHLTEIHTSGHASRAHLAEFVKKIEPKTIVPIHTECKGDFADAFGVPTMVLDDNEIKEL